MPEKDYRWAVKLDWLNILEGLRLSSIIEIPEIKREKAIKRITKTYGPDILLDLEPNQLDKLVTSELREVLKKELSNKARMRDKQEKEMFSKIIPFKRGGIIKIDPRDLKDLDIDDQNLGPEEIMKALYKKLMGEKDGDDENDDDHNKFKEDNTGYYI